MSKNLLSLATKFIEWHKAELPHWDSKMQIDGDRIGFIPDETHELWLAYQAGYEAEKWISVEESIPEPSQRCLVFRPYASSEPYGDPKIKVCMHSDKNVWPSSFHHVSHWMPIPNIPKDTLDSSKELPF